MPDPSKDPQPLDYRSPAFEEPRNSPGMFFRRAGAGGGLGCGSIVLGFLMAATSPLAAGSFFYQLLFWAPIAVVVIGSIIYDLRQRRYGLATGAIVAPLITVLGIYLLFRAICGGGY
jgi:hypothetical protein